MTGRRRYFGVGLAGQSPEGWPGRLIAVEGSDGCGSSAQVSLLREWLEGRGQPALVIGLQRSRLCGEAVAAAQDAGAAGWATLSLLHATDLADQLEREAIPALRAGAVVLADRYVFTLIARGLAQGASQDWLETLLGFAIVPDLVLYLRTAPADALYEGLARQYGFIAVDAAGAPARVQDRLRAHVLRLLGPPEG